MKEIIKVVTTLNIEVTNLRKLSKYARALLDFHATEGEDRFDEHGCEEPNVDLFDIFDAAIYEAVSSIPGVSFEGSSTYRTDWFEFDHITDRRHPNYRPSKVGRRVGNIVER